MCIVYLFQHPLIFTSGLGNKENNLSDKQSCINFLVTFETVFFISENVLSAIIQVFVVM